MAIRVGINGFGRIGRAVFRLAHEANDIEVVQINDLSPPSTLAHLAKHDSVHGLFSAAVEATQDGLTLDGRPIIVSHGADPSQIDWSLGQVDIVLECSGKFRLRDMCEAHLKSGPKKVILSAPAKGDGSDVTIVMGVNDDHYDPKAHTIVSNASCTTNCLAPVAKIIDEELGIIKGFMTTVHSYTNDQRILCGAHKDLRRARSGALNQIPTSTGAARAIGLVLPQLEGKLEGQAIRVPTPNVSIIDLVVHVKEQCSAEQVNQLFEAAAAGPLKSILDISYEPLVSSDYNGSRFSAVVDGLSTKVLTHDLVNLLAWYDNETAFSQRMVELALLVGQSLE